MVDDISKPRRTDADLADTEGWNDAGVFSGFGVECIGASDSALASASSSILKSYTPSPATPTTSSGALK